MKTKRYFNTSGPNIPEEHYTLLRKELIAKGIDLVNRSRYFTIWAPRQTGKSTYLEIIQKELKKSGYGSIFINTENYLDCTKESLLDELKNEFEKYKLIISDKSFTDFSKSLKKTTRGKIVLIIDEIEGLNPEIFGQFLHSIRNVYHSRENHCLKSIILVGVSNIVGIVQDHASPFNIADNLPIDYFKKEEVHELLHQHETETCQLFAQKVKEKIAYITAGQPGLVNGFAWKLVEDNPDKKIIDYNDYLKVEHWYIHKALDKNVANIINKARQYRKFVEQLLFEEKEVNFSIDREEIKYLYTNGIITDNENNKVKFWVPLYKKRLHNAFYPYSNGEKYEVVQTLVVSHYFDKNGRLNADKLITRFKEYVKRRGFRPFREKDENGNFKSIKEAALIYSFETYIQAFIEEAKGKIYREADTGLGKSDLIVNIHNREYLFETKKYYSPGQFETGKNQLAYYCISIGKKEAYYLVFMPNNIKYPEKIKEFSEKINGILIQTFLIEYDEEKDF
ncbi:MAG: ATP-binding protein [Bacteroidia bacterium]|nr:ATP-binding protein [Bacteroidia bacterium]